MALGACYEAANVIVTGLVVPAFWVPGCFQFAA